jgi:peptidyl-prolyl cis-trans isomerase SurA
MSLPLRPPRRAVPAATVIAACLLAAAVPSGSARGQAPERLPEGSPGGIAAIVNQDVISRGDLDHRTWIEILKSSIVHNVPPSEIERDRPYIERMVLDKMIDQRLLLQDAKKKDIGAAEEEVDREIAEQLDKEFKPVFNIQDPEDLYRFLKEKMDISRDEYRAQIREEIIINRLLWTRYFQPDIFITPGEMREYYRTHPEEFEEPSELTFLMIAVDSTPDAPRILEALDDALKQKGNEKFVELAKEFYGDQGRGEEAYLWKMGMDEVKNLKRPLPDILPRMKPGEVRPRVRITNGWRYLKMVSVKPGKKKSFEEAQPQIVKALRARYREKEKERVLAQLRKEAQIRDFVPRDFEARKPRPKEADEKAEEAPPGKVRDVSPEAVKPKKKDEVPKGDEPKP